MKIAIFALLQPKMWKLHRHTQLSLGKSPKSEKFHHQTQMHRVSVVNVVAYVIDNLLTCVVKMLHGFLRSYFSCVVPTFSACTVACWEKTWMGYVHIFGFIIVKIVIFTLFRQCVRRVCLERAKFRFYWAGSGFGVFSFFPRICLKNVSRWCNMEELGWAFFSCACVCVWHFLAVNVKRVHSRLTRKCYLGKKLQPTFFLACSTNTVNRCRRGLQYGRWNLKKLIDDNVLFKTSFCSNLGSECFRANFPTIIWGTSERLQNEQTEEEKCAMWKDVRRKLTR